MSKLLVDVIDWHINKVMRECDFKIQDAARVLGVNRRTLQRFMKRGTSKRKKKPAKKKAVRK